MFTTQEDTTISQTSLYSSQGVTAQIFGYTSLHLTTSHDSLPRFIAERILAIPQVSSVYYTQEDDELYIWTFIPRRDIPLVKLISRKQWDILSWFADAPDMPKLEFNIVYEEDI